MAKLVRFPGIQDLLVVCGFYSLLVVQLGGFASDPGVGWHLATGKTITESGSIPVIDPFLYHSQPRAWVADQWLSDLIIYGGYLIGSWPLLAFCGVLLFSWVFLVGLYRAQVRAGVPFLIASLVAISVFKIGQIHFLLRPVMIGFLLFFLVFYEVQQLSRRPEGERPSLGSVLKLFVLFLAWANLHPSFSLGLLIVWLLPLASGLSLVAERKRVRGGFVERMVPELLLALLVSVVTLVNPYGASLHESILALGRSDFFMNLHMEWRAPNLVSFEGSIFWVSVLVVLSAFLLSPDYRRKIGWYNSLALALFAYASFDAVRFLPFYGLVAALPMAWALDWLCTSKWLRSFTKLREAAQRLEAREQASARGAVGFGLGVLFSVLLCFGVARESYFQPPASKYPYQAIGFLLNSEELGGQTVVVAPPGWGGFITWYGKSKLVAIIDDRNTMIGEEFYRRFLDTLRPTGAWRDYLDSSSADFLLLSNESRLGRHIQKLEALPLVYRDSVAMVFKVLRSRQSEN